MDLQSRLEKALGTGCSIIRELGGGGMSRVFLANDVEHGREIVVKVIPSDLAGQVNVERFRREIKVAAKLQHPCIVPVLSSGDADGLPYYTMPFVEGESLRARLSREHGLPVHDAVRILRDIASAIAYAHEHGVLHRDIKPDNILVTKHHAVLVDFGVAKALTESTRAGSPLTSVGVALGTPAYMAPEQAAADPSVDHRADIYSLGVVAYEMLAGRHPFEGRSSQSMLAAHAIENPNSITVHRPNLPPQLAGLVMRMMEKHPGDRPHDADEVLTMLDQVATPTETTASPAPAKRKASSDAMRRKRLILASGFAGALITIGAISMFAFRGGFKSAPLADANVLVLEPSLPGNSTPAATADANLIVDAVNRGLVQVPSAHVTALSETASDPEQAAALGRKAGASKVITSSIYQAGDKLQVQFRVIDANTGNIIRALNPIQVAAGASPAALDSAIDPLLTVIGFATSRLLGPATIPLTQIPRFAAFKELHTGLEMSIRPDPVSYAALWQHFIDAYRLDTGFVQARLWYMWTLRNTGAVRNIHAIAYQYDTLQTYLQNHRTAMSPFESALADYVADRIATERGVQALRAIFGFTPLNPIRRDLPTLLADLNRPYAADSAMTNLVAADPWLSSQSLPWLFKAVLYHYEGDYTKALTAARHAREIAPTDMNGIRMELYSLAALGDTTNIEKLLAMAAVATRNRGFFDFAGDLYLATASELTAHGHPDYGKKILARAVEWFDKRTPEEWGYQNLALRGALVYLQAGRYADAERIARDLTRKYPGDTRYHGTLGRALALKGDSSGAIAIANQLATLPSEKFCGGPAFERAQIMAELNRRDDAIGMAQDAFGQGVGFTSYRSRIHVFPNFARMRGYPAYDALVTPGG